MKFSICLCLLVPTGVGACACTPSPAVSYCHPPFLTESTQAPAGCQCASAGMSQCTKCGAGSASSAGSCACLKCPTGSYGATKGLSKCAVAPAVTYVPGVGLSSKRSITGKYIVVCLFLYLFINLFVYLSMCNPNIHKHNEQK